MVQQWSPRKWQGLPGRISWPSITPTTHPSQHAVHSPQLRPRADASGITAPWHFLYLRPLPQGHGSLRPTGMATCDCSGRRPVYSGHSSTELRSCIQNGVFVAVYLAVLLSFLQGIAMRGAKMQVSLVALAEGASSFQVGL